MLATLRLDADQPFQVHDLLSDQRFIWRGRVQLRAAGPAAGCRRMCSRVRRRVRSEHDFDYYL